MLLADAAVVHSAVVTEIQLTSNYGPHMIQYFGRYLDQLPLD